jgi:hypothetical protein
MSTGLDLLFRLDMGTRTGGGASIQSASFTPHCRTCSSSVLCHLPCCIWSCFRHGEYYAIGATQRVAPTYHSLLSTVA